MSPLPPHYTPGHYKAVKHVENRSVVGYVVLRPAGSVLPGEPVSRSAAEATAERLNSIRAGLAKGTA